MNSKLVLVACVVGLTVGCGSQPKNNSLDNKIKEAQKEAKANPKPKTLDLVRVEFDVGVSKSTRNLTGEGVDQNIAYAVIAGAKAKEKIARDFIKLNLAQFDALHDRMPESHEEFMTEIIAKTNIELPKLNPGERYEWDPKDKKFYAYILKE